MSYCIAWVNLQNSIENPYRSDLANY